MNNLASQGLSVLDGSLTKSKRYCSSCGYEKEEAAGTVVTATKRPFIKRFVCKECMVKRASRVSPKSRYFS